MLTDPVASNKPLNSAELTDWTKAGNSSAGNLGTYGRVGSGVCSRSGLLIGAGVNSRING